MGLSREMTSYSSAAPLRWRTLTYVVVLDEAREHDLDTVHLTTRPCRGAECYRILLATTLGA